MLFWELPVPISSACSNLRFSGQCSLSCPPMLLIANTLELFCTWDDFSPMRCCRKIPPSKCPNLRLSNSKWSQSLWEHAFSSFSTNYRTDNNPAFIFILHLQGLTKVGEILLVLYMCKQRVQPLNLQNGACAMFVLGLHHFYSCLEFCTPLAWTNQSTPFFLPHSCFL